MMGLKRASLILLFALVFGGKAAVLPESSDSSSEEIDELFNEVQAKCLKKTGSNDAYEKLTEQVLMSPMCFMSKIDVESLSSDIDTLSESNRVEFFSKYCPQVSDSLSCITPIGDQLRKCLDAEDMAIMDILMNILPEALNFICRDHGEMFFVDDKKLDACTEKMTEYAGKCAEHVSNATEAMDLSNYGAKQCSELSDVRNCFETQLNECGGQKLLGLFDMFYRPFVKATPCKDFIKLDDLSAIESNAI